MSLADALPGSSPNLWARAFLAKVAVLSGRSIPQSPTNIDSIVKWMQAESGGYNPNASGGMYNPLNTTQGSNSNLAVSVTGENKNGIKDFGDFQSGVDANAWALVKSNPAFGYGKIIDALARSDQGATFQAIDASSWGTHGLGGGSTAPPNAGNVAPGDAGAPQALSSADDACLLKLPVLGCLVHPNQGRALLGAAALAGGSLVMLVGLAFLAAGTKPGRTALGVVGVIK